MGIAANPSSIPLAELRRIMEAAAGHPAHPAVLPFGIEAIDTALPGGGLALGAVHEVREDGPRGGERPVGSCSPPASSPGSRVLSSGVCTAAIFLRPHSPASASTPIASFSAKPGR